MNDLLTIPAVSRRARRWHLADATFRAAERAAFWYHRADPPMFVVGAPRTGTTLAYQLAVNCLGTSYLCNLANRHPEAPSGVTLMCRHRLRGSHSYESRYGETEGKTSPSQADAVWAKYFGTERSFREQASVSSEAKRSAATMVGRISGIVRAPFVGKSIANSVKIRTLDECFPTCVFVWIRRDPALSARSHYHNILRRPDLPWMSAKPSNFESLLHLDLPERAAAQVVSIEADIERDLSAIDPARHVAVDYEDICRSPEGYLEEISSLWLGAGVSAGRRAAPPREFRVSTGASLPADVRQRLERAVCRRW